MTYSEYRSQFEKTEDFRAAFGALTEAEAKELITNQYASPSIKAAMFDGWTHCRKAYFDKDRFTRERIESAVLGLAIGDAVGVPYEFHDTAYMDSHPATEMTGFGSHDMPPGTWSDDTSMTIALIDAMIRSPLEPDLDLIMKNFCSWYYDSKFTATDEVFDCGNTCFKAIWNYIRKKLPPEKCGSRDDDSCGNGALMRILPLLFWLEARFGSDWINDPKAAEVVYQVTSLTHGHERCLMASYAYLCIAHEILVGRALEPAIYSGFYHAFLQYQKDERFSRYVKDFELLRVTDFKNCPKDRVRSGGYVIETMDAAFWSLINTDNYKDCILACVNLGHDTDTTAAVAGGLAGLYYGLDGIPASWIRDLKKSDELKELCGNFAESLKTDSSMFG